ASTKSGCDRSLRNTSATWSDSGGSYEKWTKSPVRDTNVLPVEMTPPYALQGVRPNEEDLSDKQARILDFIQTFHAKNQRPPTNREIGRGVGIRSTSHVN